MNLTDRISLRSCLALGALILLAAPACGGDTTMMSSNAAALSGQSPVDPQGGGATVTVNAQLVGNAGQLTALIDTPAKVDASGRYQLEATVAAGTTNQLLVTAKSGGTVLGSAVVEGGFAAQGAFKVSPIDVSSTAQANLLVNAKSSGQWSAGFTWGEMRGLLSDDIAATLGANQSDLAARQAAAVVAVAPVAAWRSMLALSGFNDGKHTAALTAITTAQANLDTQLDGAANAAARKIAVNGYLAAFVKAHAEAGADAAQMSAASIAVMDSVNLYATTVEASVRGQAMARVAAFSADRVNASVMVDLASLGASQVSQVAVTASFATLNTDITAAAMAGAGGATMLKAAWQKYSVAVDAQLALALPLAANVALAAKTALDADLATLVAARANLNSSATVAATATADSAALKQFMDSGRAHAALLTASGISDAHAAAFLDAEVQLLAARGPTP